MNRPPAHVRRRRRARCLSLAALTTLALTATVGTTPPASASEPGAATTAAGSSPHRGAGPVVDLRVDSDRNGLVDVRGSGGADEIGERQGTALVLPNLDDDQGRCRAAWGGKPAVEVADRVLDGCNDASDGRVNGPADARDLAPLTLLPNPTIPRGATGRIAVLQGKSRANVFMREPGGWRLLPSGAALTAAQLRSGLTLGVEARDLVRDSSWDGSIDVVVRVRAGRRAASDRVTLRVAPFLASHHTQPTTTVTVAEPGNDRPLRQFIVRLKATVRTTDPSGATEVKVLDTATDPWMQDVAEPGYVSVPRGRGVQSMRVLLRTDQSRVGSRAVYELRGRDLGVVWFGPVGGMDGTTLDSMGNVETIPPYTHDGRSFPAGRLIVGRRGDDAASMPSARMMALLRAQGVQEPLLLDTSFLTVGHVDEMFQFVPADTALGWRLVAASPSAGMALLREAQGAGAGEQRVVRRGQDRTTVDEALGDGMESLVGPNRRAAAAVEANIDLIKDATGLTEADVVRLPALYTRDDGGAQVRPAQQGTPADDEVQRQGNFVPGAVNGLLVSPRDVVVPQQWAVEVAGVDLFEQQVEAAYRSAGITAHFVDDFMVFHSGGGEIHCGTNSLRKPTGRWWAPTAG